MEPERRTKMPAKHTNLVSHLTIINLKTRVTQP